MEPSNISTRPFWEHTFRSFNVSSHFSLTSATSSLVKECIFFGRNLYSIRLSPDVLRWYPGRHGRYLTISFPLQISTSLGSSVTTATSTASRFSSCCIVHECHPHLSDLRQQPYAPGTRKWRSLFRPVLHISSALCPDRSAVRLPVLRWQRIHRLHQSRYIS